MSIYRKPHGPHHVDSLSGRDRTYLSSVLVLTQELGYPPSRREIARAVGVSSTNAVQQSLRRLVAKEYLTMAPGIARSVALSEEGFEALGER